MARKVIKKSFDEKSSIIELSLDGIKGMHPLLESITISTSNLEYLLESVKEINPDYFLHFLKGHPIVVVKENEHYFCVSNPRLFQVANIILPASQLLQCNLIGNTELRSITLLGQTDFLFSHLLFSLRPQDADDQYCRIWEELDKDLRVAVLPGAKHLTLLAKILKTSRNQTYLRRHKDNKSTDDSND